MPDSLMAIVELAFYAMISARNPRRGAYDSVNVHEDEGQDIVEYG